MPRGTLRGFGSNVVLIDTAFEIAALLAVEQAKVNDAESGSITFHWSPESIRSEVLSRSPKRKRLTDRALGVVDSP